MERNILKKNLFIILPDSPIRPAGGLGERYSKLIPFLENEFNCFIYCYYDGGICSKSVCNEVKLPFNHLGYTSPLFMLDYIFENLSKEKPDIIIAADHQAIIPGKILSKVFNCKLIIDFNLCYFSFKKVINPDELSQTMKDYTEMLLWIEESGAKSADSIITCSDFYKRDLIWPSFQDKTISVPSGIDFDIWNKEYPPYKFPGGFKRNLVYIGRMTAQKGVQFLFDFHFQNDLIVKKPDDLILKLPEDTALHFVGGKNGGELYNVMIETTKANKQKFHIPFVMGDEKIGLMKSADAIIFPSLHEPFGIVGLETIAAKTPLITTMVNGIADYCKKDCIWITEPNTQGLSTTINSFLNEDINSVKDKVEKAYANVLGYTWENSAAIMCNILNKN